MAQFGGGGGAGGGGAGGGGGNSGGGGVAGNKNPPWARPLDMQPLVNMGQAAAAAAAAAAFGGQAGPVFQQQIPPGLAPIGAGPPPPPPPVTLGGVAMHGQVTAAYPRALAPQFLQQQQQQAAAAAVVGVSLQQQQQQHPPPGPGQPTQRVFTGTVTKLHDNFGFIDEDVFFQTSVVKGQLPRVNDRVLVEANYNTNMPFKWNASRIQVLPNQQRPPGAPAPNGGVNSVNPTATPNNLAFTNTAVNVTQPPPLKPGNRPELLFVTSNNDRVQQIGRGCPGPSNTNDQRINRQNNSPNRVANSRGGAVNIGVPNSMDKPEHPARNLDRDRRQRDDRGVNRDRDRDRSRDKDRARSPPSRKRSRSPRRTRSRSRSRSPPRRRMRTTPRYNVSIPKISLHFPQSNIVELKKRYGNMYIPSDFFSGDHCWLNSFPIHQPLRIHSPASFHVFNKDLVEPPVLSDAVFDPPDADHTYNVKVMLMASLPPEEFYEKTCNLTDNPSNRDGLIHPTRAIQFLVGLRGKNETMAIGGPWSPSLDGADPVNDPSVLIKTAIRACRSLTGIDLSQCTHWHRFLDIHYRRQESSSRPARTETTVIFLPDVWSIMPTRSEYAELELLYANALKAKIDPESTEKKKKTGATVDSPVEEVIQEEKVNKEEESSVKVLDEGEEEVVVEGGGGGEEEEEEEESLSKNNNNTNEETSSTVSEEKNCEGVDTLKTDESEETISEDVKTDDTNEQVTLKEPTYWKDLDVKSMKVSDLRAELVARSLSSKGLKSQLAGRLAKDLKLEQQKEEEEKNKSDKMKEETAVNNGDEEGEQKPPKQEVKAKEEPEVMEVVEQSSEPIVVEKKEIVKLDEKQKNVLINAYKLPGSPCIPVHPHPKAKSGKFDCTVMSLSVLLDYRTEDNKEGTFEVSLFAELFNEMLMRDTAFKLYKSVLNLPEKKSKDSNKDDAGGDDSGKDEERKKLVDKELLMACSYFDQGHCGYIENKDMEDIFYMLDVNLSRAQIKKLVQKASYKDQINYRTLVERFEEPADSSSSSSTSSTDQEDMEKQRLIGMGFKAFLPVKERSQTLSKSQDGAVCSYKGKIVDVGKLLSQLERSEKARIDTESRLIETQKTLVDFQNASEKFTSTKEKLTAEVKELKKRVRSIEEELRKSQADTSRYVSTLKDIFVRVGPLVNNDIKEEAVNGQTKTEPKSV